MPGDTIPEFLGKNFCSIGLHPWELRSPEENNQKLIMMEEALELDHVIFVGECGLDKFARPSFIEQIRTFEAQAILAEEFQKPLIIHCVKSWNELLDIHKKINPTVPWIFHGYNGSKEITQRLLKEHILFSFGSLLLKAGTKAVSAFGLLPLDRIFFETDTSNESLGMIYARGSDLKGITVDEMKKVIWENFNRIENISPEI